MAPTDQELGGPARPRQFTAAEVVERFSDDAVMTEEAQAARGRVRVGITNLALELNDLLSDGHDKARCLMHLGYALDSARAAINRRAEG